MEAVSKGLNKGYFSVETPEQGVTVVDFTKYEGENIWTKERLDAFLEIIEQLEQNPPEKGVIFLMGDHYGADIFFFAGATQEEFLEFIQKINLAFNKIEALKCQTVAVFGSCFGGGLELALACKKRIGIEHPKAKIGQTEVNFGLIPGAGGTVRLPRIIGTEAIPLIVNGEKIDADTALRIGLIDEKIQETENPYDKARKMLEEEVNEKEKRNFDVDEIRNTIRQRINLYELENVQMAALNAVVAGMRNANEKTPVLDPFKIEQYWFWTLNPDDRFKAIATFLATRNRVEDLMDLI